MNQDAGIGVNRTGVNVFGGKVQGVKKIDLSAKEAARNQRIRAHLLEQLQRTWITNVLETSLADVPNLELELVIEVDGGKRPFFQTLERPDPPPSPLPPISNVLDTYHEIGGSMLILGQTGSGKTTTLLELARDLREIALQDDQQPIPLVFNLSTWSQERPLPLDWLADELFLVYGIGRQQAAQWLTTMPYHLLLDGLDEVSAQHRADCLNAIVAFHNEHRPGSLIVASRTAEYQELPIDFHFPGTAVLQPLTPSQINAYLATIHPNLPQIASRNQTLLELAQTPLALRMLTPIYRDPPQEQQLIPPPPTSPRQLCTAYVNRLLHQHDPAGKTDTKQTIHSLTFLAARMRENNQTIFYPEKMQPTWPGSHAPHYKRNIRLTLGLLTGLNAGLFSTVLLGIFGIAVGEWLGLLLALLISWLIIGPIGGLIGGRTLARGGIKPTQSLAWSWKESLTASFIIGMVIGGIFGVFSGIIFLDSAWDRGLTKALSIGLIISNLFTLGTTIALTLFFFLSNFLSALLIFVPIFAVNNRFSRKEVRAKPNRGIRLSSRLAAIAGLSMIPYFGVIFLLLFFSAYDSIGDIKFGFFFGMLWGLFNVAFSGLKFGGAAVVKHYTLRWTMSRSNHLPFKLISFLDDMVEYSLLHRVGSGYTFSHPLLLHYFADLENDSL